jgi:lipase
LGEYHILAPDLLGHGHSPWEPPWSIAEHVAAIVDTVGAREAMLVGHSFGGRLAFEIAARAPKLVPRLVLLDPAILLPGHVGLAAAERERIDKSYVSFEELVERRYDESQLHLAPRDLVVTDLAQHVEVDEQGRIRYRYCQSAVVAAYGEMSSQPPPFEDVRIPTLLVLGERSYLPYDHLLEAHRAAVGDLLEVVVVPGGHSVLWDAFDETASAIERFLGG